MEQSLAQLIAVRAKRDPIFKQQVIDALSKKLARTIKGTAQCRRLERAITSLENMK
jgi:hypothetical protein